MHVKKKEKEQNFTAQTVTAIPYTHSRGSQEAGKQI